MRKNRLRELLDSGKPSLGTHLSISWPAITELVGHARVFDYVEFVAEYTPYDLYSPSRTSAARSTCSTT